jgi:hypothetical protein
MPRIPHAAVDASAAWSARRLLWLTTGVFGDAPRGAHGEALLARLGDALRRLRAQRAERASLAKPIRVREGNVLAALREPSRLLEFNRPMPLPRLVALMNTLWEEDAAAARAAAAAAAAAGAGGAGAGVGAGAPPAPAAPRLR